MERVGGMSEGILLLVDKFAKEFENFLKIFFETYGSIRIHKSQQELLKAKITENIGASVHNYIEANSLLIFKTDSPSKKSGSNSPLIKKTSRALQFKN